MFRWGLRIGSVLLVGVAAWLLLDNTGSAGGPNAKPLLPPAEFTALVKGDAKVLEELLAKDKIDKKVKRKINAAAYMIAVYAYCNTTKDNAAQMATLYNAALKVMKLTEDGKHKEAAALAKTLPSLKADPSAKADFAALTKVTDFGEVMHQFSSERVGGFGIEKELGDLSEEKSLTPAQIEKLGTIGYRMAAIAQVSRLFTDEKEDKTKDGRTVKSWIAQADQFRKLSLDLATAARSKNAGTTKDALDKASTSCVKCHDIFR